jgi:hypothetical protein
VLLHPSFIHLDPLVMGVIAQLAWDLASITEQVVESGRIADVDVFRPGTRQGPHKAVNDISVCVRVSGAGLANVHLEQVYDRNPDFVVLHHA